MIGSFVEKLYQKRKQIARKNFNKYGSFKGFETKYPCKVLIFKADAHKAVKYWSYTHLNVSCITNA